MTSTFKPKTAKEKYLHESWTQANINDCPEDCHFLQKTVDIEAYGDERVSRVEYHMACTHYTDCPRLYEFEDTWNDLQEDLGDEAE